MTAACPGARFPFIGRAVRRGATVLAPLLVLLVAGVAAADTPPPSRLLSKYETSTVSLARDCGFSQPLPSGRSLWLFCDTEVWKHLSTGWKQTSLIWGNTAAEGPYAAGLVPNGLTEVPSPPKALTFSATTPPQRFQSNPTDLYVPGANPPQKCPTPLAWPNGVASVPGRSSLFLITFLEVCNNNHVKTIEGAEMLEYNSTLNRVVGGPWEVYKASTAGSTLPAPERLGSPVFSSDQKTLYLFSSTCQQTSGTCTSGAVYLAKVAATSTAWGSASNYSFWNPTTKTWTSSQANAGSVLPAGDKGAIATTVTSFSGKGLVLIENTDLGGGYKVWESASSVPTGPWVAGPSGAAQNCSGGAHTAGYFCRSFVGHPELSTASDLLMSYFSPDSTAYPPAGHEIVVAIPW